MPLTTRFEDLQLRIPSTIAAINKRLKQKIDGRENWRRPRLTIELIYFGEGRKSSPNKKHDNVDVTERYSTSKKMTSYFNQLEDGWSVIRFQDAEKKWVRKTKTGKLKKIDFTLRIHCHYCHFEETKLLPNLPYISMNVVTKPVYKVIQNCHPEIHGCCLEDLWLDFSDKDYIGYPKRYNIGRCIGKCDTIGLNRDTIESKSLKVASHLFLLNVLSKTKDSKKKLCCAPKRYEPMGVLYRNRDNFQLMMIQKVVVTECGCG